MKKGAFFQSRRGSIAVTTALAMPILLGFVAFGVDLGSVYLAEKRLQGATDLAALSAASTPAEAESMVRTVLADNGFPDAAFTIEYGTFVADRAVPVAERFMPLPAGGNALRVHAGTQTPLYFARIFRKDDVGLVAHSVAAVASRASFSIASRLASLEGGIVNQILAQTLGANASLSLLDANALAAASIDAGALAGALAALSPKPTYGEVFDTELDAKLFLAALSEAARDAGGLNAASIVNRLANQTGIGRIVLRPAKLLSIPDISNLEVGYPARALDLDVNLLDLVTATMLANAHKTAITLKVPVPLLSDVSVAILLGEAEQASIAAAPVGTKVSTAQVKARIEIDLLGKGLLAQLGKIRLPIELVVASGSAVLTDATCRRGEGRATLAATSGIAKVEIGDWGSQPLAKASMERLPKPAKLVSVLGITVTTRAVVQLADTQPESLAFDAREIEAGTVKTVDTRHLLHSVAGGLIDSLESLEISVLGLPLIPKNLLRLNLLDQISAVAAPIDTVLGSVLDLAGLSLGEADLRVRDVGCGGATIVG